MTEEETVIKTVETKEDEKKPRGRPTRKSSTKSWEPANLIDIPKRFQDPNFTYACFDWKRPGRITQKINEGWEIDKHIIPAMRRANMLPDLPASIQDGVPKDDTLQFRELIVMRLRKERAEARQRYLDDQDPLKNKVAAEAENLDQQLNGRAYGDIKLKKGG